MEAYRVFVAYSHNDAKIRDRVVTHLRSLGVRPTWDEQLRPAIQFDDQIKKKIAHAHVFMPLLTASTSRTAWVHQEIGFATALNIPVLPLAIGELPEAFIAGLQAIVLTNVNDLGEKLSLAHITNEVVRAVKDMPATFECAAYPGQRNRMLSEYASEVLRSGDDGHVRHWGTYTTFGIPNRDITHEEWRIRQGDEPRTPETRKELLDERRCFEHLSRDYGCDLILSPFKEIRHLPKTARKVRWETLHDFLSDVSDDQVRAVITTPGRVDGNLHIVGDRFFAESFAPRRVGFLQTMFTRHAPTVIRRVQEFDTFFAQLLPEYVGGAKSSRRVTLERLEHAIRDC